MGDSRRLRREGARSTRRCLRDCQDHRAGLAARLHLQCFIINNTGMPAAAAVLPPHRQPVTHTSLRQVVARIRWLRHERAERLEGERRTAAALLSADTDQVVWA
jgi:hypothetical protein